MEKLKYIAKYEGGKNGNAILFFPECEANPGNMVCYAHTGQHSEACLAYYWQCKNPIGEKQVQEVAALVNEYQRFYGGLHEFELVRVRRDTEKMRQKRKALR
jgi:hypothetical protein